jgi:hypothetical protein
MRAKLYLLILSILVLTPGSLNAQSTLVFTRIMSGADLPFTGYAVTNPSPVPATVVFTLYAGTGTTVASTSVNIGAGGQVAKLGSELFPGAVGGWVKATSATPNLRGFWLGGDFSTVEDGGEAVSGGESEFILPIISANSEINIVNTSTSSGGLLIRLLGPEGEEINDPDIRFLAASGSFKSKSLDLRFTAAELSRATHAKVSCMVTCSGSILVTDFLVSPSLVVANGVSTASAATRLDFPHVVDGVLGNLTYSTVLSVTNLTAFAQTLVITFTPEGGIGAVSAQRELPANGTVRESPNSLFGDSGVRNGWIRVTSEQPITGVVIYSEQVNKGAAVTPGLSRTGTGLLLSHIADLPPWLTGVALLNPQGTPATVEVFAITPAGTLIGRSVPIVIAPGDKIARLLSEWIPQTQNRPVDGGFVFIRSSVPISGIELFFRRDLRVLSNVPAFVLGPNEIFTPPPQ